jgi:hypothetical protein
LKEELYDVIQLHFVIRCYNKCLCFTYISRHLETASLYLHMQMMTLYITSQSNKPGSTEIVTNYDVIHAIDVKFYEQKQSPGI